MEREDKMQDLLKAGCALVLVVVGLIFAGGFCTGFFGSGAMPSIAKLLDETSYFDAVKNGTVEEIQKWISDGGDLNKRTRSGLNGLMVAAASNNNADSVKFIASKTQDANSRDENGFTAFLHAVARQPNDEVLKTLLNEGCDATARADRRGALEIAASHNDSLSVLQFVFALSTPSSEELTGALHGAAANTSNPAVIDFLLDNGAAIAAKDRSGDTALHIACRLNPTSDIALRLLDRGAPLLPGKSGDHPLIAAANTGTVRGRPAGRARLIRAIAEKMAYVDVRNDADQTPLIVACSGVTDPEVVKVLLELGSNPNLRDRFGRTAIDYAEESSLRSTSVFWELKDAAQND